MTDDTAIQDESENKASKKDAVTVGRIVGQADGKSIVQWFEDGRVRRSLINTSDNVRLGEEPGTILVEEAKLRRRPYGDDLASLIVGLPDAEAITARLNQVGIWTHRDVIQHQNEVMGAFRATINDAYQGLIVNAKKESAQ